MLVHYRIKNQYMRSIRGIALIQVLLITAILSVLALYLSNTARQQITIAKWADDKAQAQVNLQSAEAKLLFTLLTQSKTSSDVPQQNQNVNPLSQRWNFHNSAFSIDENVIAYVQDQAGLLHAHYIEQELLQTLLLSQGLNFTEVRRIIDNLLDWQDLDNVSRPNGAESDQYGNLIRDGKVPDIHDFSFVKGITPELHQLLLNTLTQYRQGPFNPTTSPFELLKAITSSEAATQVIELREAKQLTKQIFSQITGITEDDNIFFYPSNFLAITLVSQVGESQVLKKMIIQLKPYAIGEQRPLEIYLNRG